MAPVSVDVRTRGAARAGGAVGILGREAALDVATFVGISALVAWGVVFARREGHGPAGVVAAAAMNATVGLLIIGFKVAVR